jgi:hypothetical protein
MRELLVAQKKINYRALLRMCVDRQVGSQGLYEG